MMHQLTYPFTAAKIRKLSVGDKVSVSGRIITGRDRVHEHLFNGKPSPVVLKSGAIYHCGPVITREAGSWLVKAAGPTTSTRAEQYMPQIIKQHKIGIIIGKGGMGNNTLAACVKYGCAYLHTIGGAAQVLADKITKVAGVYFLNEFGLTEAMWEFDVEDFPAIVTMDANGNSLHAEIADKSKKALSIIY